MVKWHIVVLGAAALGAVVSVVYPALHGAFCAGRLAGSLDSAVPPRDSRPSGS